MSAAVVELPGRKKQANKRRLVPDAAAGAGGEDIDMTKDLPTISQEEDEPNNSKKQKQKPPRKGKPQHLNSTTPTTTTANELPKPVKSSSSSTSSSPSTFLELERLFVRVNYAKLLTQYLRESLPELSSLDLLTFPRGPKGVNLAYAFGWFPTAEVARAARAVGTKMLSCAAMELAPSSDTAIPVTVCGKKTEGGERGGAGVTLQSRQAFIVSPFHKVLQLLLSQHYGVPFASCRVGTRTTTGFVWLVPPAESTRLLKSGIDQLWGQDTHLEQWKVPDKEEEKKNINNDKKKRQQQQEC